MLVPASSIVSGDLVSSQLPAVLKSQVPIGGRGKAGGIRVVATSDEAASATQDLLNLPIHGHTPTTILAEEVLAIRRELYLSLYIDRDAAAMTLLAHREGGVEIEFQSTSGFFTRAITPETAEACGRALAEYYDLPKQAFFLQELCKNLLSCFQINDATLIEINPLVLTNDDQLIAGDCKMELDDAAHFRHPDWHFETAVTDSNFVVLNPEGTVATIANGAGLAMATVDAVSARGLVPANFLDIGGGASKDSALAAFKRIMEFPNIEAIVINIFAGITRCDEVASAIIAAKRELTSLPPLFIRLSGTNFEAAVQLLDAEHIATLPTLEACLDSAKEVLS